MNEMNPDPTLASMKRKIVPGRDPAIAPYSPGIAVGDLFFVSGQGPLDFETSQFSLGTIEHETTLTLQNLARVLAAAGCGMEDCVKVTVHLANIADFDRFNETYQRFFSPPYPARTTVQSVLGKGISVEIDAIAIRGCGGRAAGSSGTREISA
jgi:2-iminobutanoate/2-iminopropanoate deaminase